jgi:glycosyltransferase involved in cell wall biosynthesis
MDAARIPAVLHLTAAAGGGVDRYIRDLAAPGTRDHLIWHAVGGANVLEEVAARRFWPLREDVPAAACLAAGRAASEPPAAAPRTTEPRTAGPVSDGPVSADPLAAWLRAAGVGIVHLHSLTELCRARLAWLRRALGVPFVATLHDLTFLDPDVFAREGEPAPVAAWVAATGSLLREAAAVIAPSDYIAGHAAREFPGLALSRIAPGIPPAAGSAAAGPAPGAAAAIPVGAQPGPATAPAGSAATAAAPPDFAARRPAHVVAVVGAVGPHKGSELLADLVRRLEGTGIAVVVVGYTDTRLVRGWDLSGRLYVHGPYVDGELAHWLDAYGVEIVLFPNRLPESFSYALSEAWAAGRPVVVPDAGALGERVARHGGGWRLRAGFDAAEAAALLARLFGAGGEEERRRVESRLHAHDAQRVPTLAAMVREVEALYARYAVPPSGSAEPAALAPLLAANLDGRVFRPELVKLTGELAAVEPRLSRLERDLGEAQTWARKLERDVADLQGELAREVARNREFAPLVNAFARLPRWLRDWILGRASRARR